jgi:predicted AlkP superfamily pyrophosphatase or phosphodiesterase
MASLKFFALLYLSILVTMPALAEQAESMLIVSIDALHPAALSQENSPTLHALMLRGHFTLQGRSVDPPKTLIAHTAMMTGLPPELNGKRDNDWKPGEPRLMKSTLFDDARQHGFRTAFYYAKPKLGYLVGNAVDEYGLAPDAGIDKVRSFFRQSGSRLAFLHVSGLEQAGSESGWLSADYLEELGYIDAALAPLLDDVSKRGTHAIIVTSDHAGHERQHGTSHPDDYALPLIVSTNLTNAPRLPRGIWMVTGLRSMVREFLGWPVRHSSTAPTNAGGLQ